MIGSLYPIYIGEIEISSYKFTEVSWLILLVGEQKIFENIFSRKKRERDFNLRVNTAVCAHDVRRVRPR
jgi:hypothetical protein